MSELIRVNCEGEKQTTSARDLWEFLGRPYTEFVKWFSKYKEYGFTENQDFRELRIKIRTSNGAEHDAVDYEITIDMAKELAMLQKSEKGKQARLYFIELEKRWNSPEALMARALKMADSKILEYRNSVLQLENKIKQDKPKVIFSDAVAASKISILIGALAKLIKQNGHEIGQNRLFEWLSDNGYLIKRKGSDYNMPTQKSMTLELFEVKESAITHSDGHVTVNKTTKVTGKGQQYFINKFLNTQSA